MSTIQKNTKIANRYGLNIRICDSNDTSKVYQTIDFANISSLDLSGDTVYARGGARQEKRIGFYDKLVGEFTLSTQILTNDLLCLMTGNTGNWDGESPITFKNRLLEKVRTFTLFGDTVWKDEDGNVYAEEIVLHKVRPRIAYNRSYDGSGDVASVDIVFDLMEDENGLVFSASKGEELIIVAETLISPYGVIETGDIWDVNNAGTVENGVLSLTGEAEDVDPPAEEALLGTWVLNSTSLDFSMVSGDFQVSCEGDFNFYADENTRYFCDLSVYGLYPSQNGIFLGGKSGSELVGEIALFSYPNYLCYSDPASGVNYQGDNPTVWSNIATFTISSLDTTDTSQINQLYAFLQANATKQ